MSLCTNKTCPANGSLKHEFVSSAPFILFHKYSCLFLRIFLTCNVAVLRAVSFF
jgi:hypothetical protein